MKVLGVDNGGRTGYGIVKDLKFITASHFITQGETIPEKIASHYDLLRSVILHNAPDIISVEVPNDMTGINKVNLSRGYFASTIILAHHYGIKLVGVHAMTLKKAITGNGHAEKVQVCDTLVRDYNVPRSMIEIPVYYKKKVDENGNLTVKEYLYDESDGTALAYYIFRSGDIS